MKTLILASTIALSAFAAGEASAQVLNLAGQANINVQVDGTTTINANVGDINSVAIGQDVIAVANVGTVDQAYIGGSLLINASAGDINSIAIGRNAISVAEVGAIRGAMLNGATEINASAGDINSVAIGDRACAEARVGSIGGGRC